MVIGELPLRLGFRRRRERGPGTRLRCGQPCPGEATGRGLAAARRDSPLHFGAYLRAVSRSSNFGAVSIFGKRDMRGKASRRSGVSSGFLLSVRQVRESGGLARRASRSRSAATRKRGWRRTSHHPCVRNVRCPDCIPRCGTPKSTSVNRAIPDKSHIRGRRGSTRTPPPAARSTISSAT